MTHNGEFIAHLRAADRILLRFTIRDVLWLTVMISFASQFGGR
jgi:hypothetical protein